MKIFSILSARNLIVFVVALGLGYTAYVINPISVVPEAKAGTDENISGWAWSLGTQMGTESANPTAGPYSTTPGSSSGVGWISFNSIDCDQDNNLKIDTACGSNNTSITVNDYGVNLATTNKGGGNNDFSGKAWGENIGWISFDQADTAFCGTRAQINWSSGKVTGWARALSGSIVAGEWDGCIKLSDDTNTSWNGKGVRIDQENSKRFTGYAWGSDVLGWIDFAPKVNGKYVGTEFDGGTTSCTAPDVDPSTLTSCAPISECVTAGVVVDGFQRGSCLTGGEARVYGCNYTCPTTIVAPPSTGKKKFWEF